MPKLFQNIAFLVFVLIGQVNCNLGNDESQCFVQGECSDSYFVGESPVFSETECIYYCRENPACLWWTFYPDIPTCAMFANCNKLNTELCPNCVSGEKVCSPRPQCWIQGQCQGLFLHLEQSESKEKCLSLCKNFQDCQWFTWDSIDQACSLFKECSTIDTSCEECISGEKLCPTGSRLFIATGKESNETTEIINIEDEAGLAYNLALPSLPFDLHGAVGYLHNGDSPMICGGFSNQMLSYRSECFLLNNLETWVSASGLLKPLGYGGSSSGSSGWFITGGYNTESNLLDTVYLLKDSFWQKINSLVPTPINLHCMIKIAEDKLLVIGGMNQNDQFSKQTMVFETESNTWSLGPTLAHGRRAHSCSKVTYQEKDFVVVAGGENEDSSKFVSVEMLEIGSEGGLISQWLPGPDLPVPIAGAVLVEQESTGLAYLVGGQDLTDGRPLDTIYKLSLENEKWIEMPQKLTHGRYLHVAFFLND